MRAEEAFKLAEAQGDITEILNSIKTRALLGKTDLTIPMVNDFQVTKLKELGYQVLNDHAPGTTFIIGSQKPTHHKICWSSWVVKELT